jgi:hypothetical protein
MFWAELDPRPAMHSDEMRVDSNEVPIVIIKFVRRYSVEAHKYCANQGCSPRLLGYEMLAGGWYMLVMEEVDLAIYEPFVISSSSNFSFLDHEQLRAMVMRLIKGLHDKGYVHGTCVRPTCWLRLTEDGSPCSSLLILTGLARLEWRSILQT